MTFDSELLAALEGLPDPDPDNPADMRSQQGERLTDVTGGAVLEDEHVVVFDRAIPGPEGAPDLTVRIYRPRAQGPSTPAFVYFHGGGFIAGDLDTAHLRALMIATDIGCVVVSVEYRLAPEHPFPAGPEDCYAALLWTSEHADELGIDPERLVVGGESSGGALAAAVTQMARDRGGPPLAFQLLLYPVIDDRMETPSMRAGTSTPVWDAGRCRTMWRHYLGDAHGQARTDVSPYAAPGRASDLSGLPDAYVLTCDGDPLRDEGIDYAQRLLQAGVAVELHNVPHTYHGFDLIGMSTTVGKRSLYEQHDALRRAMFDVPSATPAR